MNTKQKVTAIVSLFNSSRWLRNRIRNLQETETYRRGELFIFCVNAQSPDPEDDAIANQFAGVHNYHYQIIEPATCYGAWNYALKKCFTPYVTQANTDDIVAPDCYDKLMAACESTGAVLAYPDWYVMVEENQLWRPGASLGQREQAGQYNPEGGNLSCGHFPLWRLELHDRIGYFDPSLRALGDADLWFRSWRSGIRNFYHFGEPLGGYLWRNGNNLWHRVDDSTRAAEWARLFGRKPGKLEF